jgi:hypothetical protein
MGNLNNNAYYNKQNSYNPNGVFTPIQTNLHNMDFKTVNSYYADKVKSFLFKQM